ncbi:MAG TPA: NusG domain II-containing protein [Gammaproteobacteria bacterium]|nr:NusG domain II-containing protein [Gammaproteobacteria bacterium]
MKGLLAFLLRATTPADRVAVVAAWAAVSALAVSAWSAPAGGEAVVLVGDHEVRRLNLARDQRVTVQGRIGPAELQVKDGAVRFVHSPCSSKRCIRMGWQHRRGAGAACVPNEVMVRVTGGGSGSGWDAVNY